MSAKEVESVEAILEQHLPEGDLDAVKAILYGKPLKYRKTKTTNNRFPLLIFLLWFLGL
jgi:muramoyltetrapeptide carboxypeptidase LdcA involved in peptidoglycan recycling